MATDPLISIVLPTFNGNRYLSDAIQSCISQSYRNWELIVVDDGSTDDSADIATRAAKDDRRIKLLTQENRGLPAALNKGFSVAKGKYFTWTSDDNTYHDCALEKMLNSLEKNPDVDIVYAGMSLVNDLGQFIENVKGRNPHELGFRGNVVGACFLFKREVFDTAGPYQEDLAMVEDYYFWLMAADKFKFSYLNEILYRYRIHSQSLSSRNPNRDSHSEKATTRALGFCTRNNCLRAGMFSGLALIKLQAGFIREAFENLLKALSTAPFKTLLYGPKKAYLQIALKFLINKRS